MRQKFIDLKTSVPGPKSLELLAREAGNEPCGPFQTMKIFAEKTNGALLTDVDGNTFLDFSGAAGSLYVGHCPEKAVHAREVNGVEKSRFIEEEFMKRFTPLKSQFEHVGDVHCLGAMCAIEIVEDKSTKKPAKEMAQKILERCHQNGLILMSAVLYGNVIRLLAPMVITEDQLEEGFEVLEEAIAACCNSVNL